MSHFWTSRCLLFFYITSATCLNSLIDGQEPAGESAVYHSFSIKDSIILTAAFDSTSKTIAIGGSERADLIRGVLGSASERKVHGLPVPGASVTALQFAQVENNSVLIYGDNRG